MSKEKIEVGEIRPIYNVTGFHVCKVSGDNPEEAQWTQVASESEAEILSFIYQRSVPKKKAKKKVIEEDNEEEEIADDDL